MAQSRMTKAQMAKRERTANEYAAKLQVNFNSLKSSYDKLIDSFNEVSGNLNERITESTKQKRQITRLKNQLKKETANYKSEKDLRAVDLDSYIIQKERFEEHIAFLKEERRKLILDVLWHEQEQRKYDALGIFQRLVLVLKHWYATRK